MASIEIVKVTNVEDHPTVSNLSIVTVKGWPVVSERFKFQVGDEALYLRMDTFVPRQTYNQLDIGKFLKKTSNKFIKQVKASRVHGIPSYGVITTIPKLNNLNEQIEFDKAVSDHSLSSYFNVIEHTHTNSSEISYWQDFPYIIAIGEDIAITEKLNGTHHKIGLINGKFTEEKLDRKYEKLLWNIHHNHNKKNVIIYGEQFENRYRAFDILIWPDTYMDFDEKIDLLTQYNINTVPILYRGMYFAELIEQFTYGNCYLDGSTLREGIVILPATERQDVAIGRVVLQSINVDFLSRRKKNEVPRGN